MALGSGANRPRLKIEGLLRNGQGWTMVIDDPGMEKGCRLPVVARIRTVSVESPRRAVVSLAEGRRPSVSRAILFLATLPMLGGALAMGWRLAEPELESVPSVVTQMVPTQSPPPLAPLAEEAPPLPPANMPLSQTETVPVAPFPVPPTSVSVDVTPARFDAPVARSAPEPIRPGPSRGLGYEKSGHPLTRITATRPAVSRLDDSKPSPRVKIHSVFSVPEKPREGAEHGP